MFQMVTKINDVSSSFSKQHDQFSIFVIKHCVKMVWKTFIRNYYISTSWAVFYYCIIKRYKIILFWFTLCEYYDCQIQLMFKSINCSYSFLFNVDINRLSPRLRCDPTKVIPDLTTNHCWLVACWYVINTSQICWISVTCISATLYTGFSVTGTVKYPLNDIPTHFCITWQYVSYHGLYLEILFSMLRSA